jgi:hypothetical protein
MKENQETTSHDRKPQGTAPMSASAEKMSAKRTLSTRGGEKKKPKSDKRSRAAGQRK